MCVVCVHLCVYIMCVSVYVLSMVLPKRTPIIQQEKDIPTKENRQSTKTSGKGT